VGVVLGLGVTLSRLDLVTNKSLIMVAQWLLQIIAGLENEA